MKTAIELRQHIIDKIGSSGANLLGTRSYGATVEPSILILPDSSLEDSGMSFPAIIDGSPVTYQGIEAVVYNGYEGNEYSALLNSEARLDSEIWILLKDWNTSQSDDLTMAALLVSKGTDIIETKTPPNPDNAPLVKSIILVIGYAGYL